MCVSSTCSKAWDSCPDGLIQTSLDPVIDNEDCDRSPACTPGGCAEGWAETRREPCYDPVACADTPGLCFKETCCRLRQQATCCQPLQCTLSAEGSGGAPSPKALLEDAGRTMSHNNRMRGRGIGKQA